MQRQHRFHRLGRSFQELVRRLVHARLQVRRDRVERNHRVGLPMPPQAVQVQHKTAEKLVDTGSTLVLHQDLDRPEIHDLLFPRLDFVTAR